MGPTAAATEDVRIGRVYYIRSDFDDLGMASEDSIKLLEQVNAPPELIEATREIVQQQKATDDRSVPGATDSRRVP